MLRSNLKWIIYLAEMPLNENLCPPRPYGKVFNFHLSPKVGSKPWVRQPSQLWFRVWNGFLISTWFLQTTNVSYLPVYPSYQSSSIDINQWQKEYMYWHKRSKSKKVGGAGKVLGHHHYKSSFGANKYPSLPLYISNNYIYWQSCLNSLGSLSFWSYL